MDKKSLYDISWKVDEATYREDPALSYSILAKYERTGFNGIEHLFDRVETPSLTFGSAVDSIITGGQSEFDERFLVAEFQAIPDSIVKIVKTLYNVFGKENLYRNINDIPNKDLLDVSNSFNYQMNWKPETRAKVIKEKGEGYYNLLFVAGERTIIDNNTYQEVCNAVRALKESESTKFYFADDNPFEPDIERFYQLKFKGIFGGIAYRNMADLIIVNHKEKWVKPVDLKTSSHYEWDFYKSFNEWRYDIQGRLYWAIIRQNMDNDEYFKDFKLLNYEFIVVNKHSLTPLVWVCPFTESTCTLKFGKNDQIEYRSPFTIGKELYNYLSTKAKIPNGISTVKPNNLSIWLKTL